jgi:hypothetical protein
MGREKDCLEALSSWRPWQIVLEYPKMISQGLYTLGLMLLPQTNKNVPNLQTPF